MKGFDINHLKCKITSQGFKGELKANHSSSIATLKAEIMSHPFGERLRVILIAHQDVTIQEVSYRFRHRVSDDAFMTFNGYQSWTDTQPLQVNDKMPYLRSWVKPLVSKYQFDKYGDTLIHPFKHGKGRFHGFTYVTLCEQETTLLASVHEQSGYTMFEYHHAQSLWTITKDNQHIEVSDECVLLDIICLKGTQDEVFDAYASILNIKLKTTSTYKGWTSWYYHYQNISESIILSNLKALKASQAELDVIQIDDGYQTKIGDWLSMDKQKFPHGLTMIVNHIHHEGFKAGCWLAPCVCQIDSDIALHHPHWLIQDDHQQPLLGGSNWGGFYILDMQNEQVKAYLRQVFNVVLNEWGFDLVKLDFLYAAALKPTATKTRGQLMHETMVFLRECVGDKLILGCGVPLGSAFGLVDFCRIGCDVGLDYDGEWYMKYMHRERISTYHSINNAIGRYPLNQRFFLNDPDVFILRDEANQLTHDQKDTLALVNRLMHGLLFTSDDVRTYNATQMKCFKTLMNHKSIQIINIQVLQKGVYHIEWWSHHQKYSATINTEPHPYITQDIRLSAFQSRSQTVEVKS